MNPLARLAAAVFAQATVQAPAPPRTSRPNLIFVMADDLGWGELGCYGQSKIKTPRLDQMAREGRRFTDWYASSPVCAPSRCSLLTGLHSGHSAIRDNRELATEGQAPLPAGTATLARALSDAGYATGIFGKWGLGGPGSSGAPNEQGFDCFFGYLCQREAHNHYPTHLWSDAERVELEGNVAGNQVGVQFAHDRIVDEAFAFVRQHQDAPFFLYLPFTFPHVALQVPAEALAEYGDSLGPELPYDGKQGYLQNARPHATYAAMVTRLDRDVGRLLDLLLELHLDERTLVVFTSDNGPTHGQVGGADSDFFASAGPWRGRKGDVYEGGLRVPFLARWPGRIPAGTTSEAIGCHYDVMATLLDLAGAPPPGRTDGMSQAAALLGDPCARGHEWLLFEFPGYGGQQAIRLGQFKGVRRGMAAAAKAGQPLPPLELYDLLSDPAESRDCTADHPEIVERIEMLLREQHVPNAEFMLPGVDR